MIPTAVPAIVVQATLGMAGAIIGEASLSVLGLGVQPPTPSWGVMIQGGARLMTSGEWWVSLFPGLAVFLAIMSLNLIADELDIIFERSSR